MRTTMPALATKADPLVDVSFFDLDADVVVTKNGKSALANGDASMDIDDAVARVRRRRAVASYSRSVMGQAGVRTPLSGSYRRIVMTSVHCRHPRLQPRGPRWAATPHDWCQAEAAARLGPQWAGRPLRPVV